MTPEALAALHARAFTMPPPWSAAAFRGLLESEGVFLCTAASGFALGRAVAGEAELLTIAVEPAARGQGTGRALLDAFEAEAAARGAATAFLEVAADNGAALALYDRAGYRETARRRGYYRGLEGPVDAAILARDLTPA